MRYLNAFILTILIASVSICLAGPKFTSMGSPTSVTTFESIGITCPFTGDDNFNSVCNVEYKAEGSSEWKKGHPLYTCKKKRQHRGSIVHVKPGTSYDIKLTVTDKDGGTATRTLTAKTWNEKFPEGKKTFITKQTTALTISTSGTPSGYAVYEGSNGKQGTIDGLKKVRDCININASYVIIRNLKIIRPQWNGIRINPNCHDIVIDNCEITDFGLTLAPGSFDYDKASGIICYDGGHRAKRIVIQNCKIYNPSGRANSWKEKGALGGYHPAGPQAISLWATAGNNVIRYNHVFSTKGQCYNDAIGTEGRYTWCDTDVYGNIVSYSFDDGMEMESLNSNLRIWGNVIHNTNMGIASRVHNRKDENGKVIGSGDVQLGPVYVWRNLFHDQWKVKGTEVGHVLKMRGDPGYYFYNNTVLRSPSLGKIPKYVTNTDWTDNFVAKNNIMVAQFPVIWLYKNYWTGGQTYGSYLNTNMYEKPRSSVSLRSTWEAKGIFSTTAQYNKIGQYGYVLKPGTKGVDAGEKIPNFADVFAGKAPDIGACEKGVFEMPVGPNKKSSVRRPQPFKGLAVASMQHGLKTRVFNAQGQLLGAFAGSGTSLRKSMSQFGHGVFFLAGSETMAQSPRRMIIK